MPCGFESHLSHQNIGYPFTGWPIFLYSRWDSKARPERSEGIKQSRGLFYRAWESPLNLRRIRNGCGSNSNMSGAEKVLVQRTFSKSPIRTLAPNISELLLGFGDVFVYARDGTRKAGLAFGKATKCPVDTLLARGSVPQVSDPSQRDVDEI